MTAKEEIIELFRTNVKGKRPNVDGKNERHDGRKGHWLEQQFGVTANADNEADLFGYELKNETTSKTTFGDWSANIYVNCIVPKKYCLDINKQTPENHMSLKTILSHNNHAVLMWHWLKWMSDI